MHAVAIDNGRRTDEGWASSRPSILVNEQGQPALACFADQIAAIASCGDRAAFANLFGHFAPRVKTYMLRLGATPQLAEDLAQETMLAVWRKAGAYDASKAAASTWIFTIARNLRIDATRRERPIE